MPKKIKIKKEIERNFIEGYEEAGKRPVFMLVYLVCAVALGFWAYHFKHGAVTIYWLLLLISLAAVGMFMEKKGGRRK